MKKRASAQKVLRKHIDRRVRVKTAGEVRFVKDRSGDKGQWAYADTPPSERGLTKANYRYEYKARNVRIIADCLRSTAAALGHSMSAYQKFAKMKSPLVSPDGLLGGKGFIQRISDMRRQYMNIIEALSSLTDTLYDEVNGPHWAKLKKSKAKPGSKAKKDQAEARKMIEQAEEIREDPTEWADKELEEDLSDKELL